MKSFGKMIKQAQELQAKMSALQEELGQKQMEAMAGGGMVTAVVNGNQELVSLTIEKEVVDPEDVELLQDLITAAVNEAVSRSKEMVRDEMTKLTGGMQIPGLT